MDARVKLSGDGRFLKCRTFLRSIARRAIASYLHIPANICETDLAKRTWRESSNRGLNIVIHNRPSSAVSRRAFLTRILPAAGAAAALPFDVRAQSARSSFEAWRDAFRHRAAAH